MSFIRIKRVQGKEYAYLVENYWTNNSSRQKVKDYLGKVLRFDKKETSLQIDKTKSHRDYVLDLVIKELLNHGFKENNKSFENNDISINLAELGFKKRNKDVVLSLNEGFLCKKTVEDLLNFKVYQDEREDRIAIRLAKTILEAGLKTSHEEFIALFEKIVPEKKQEKVEIYY